MVLTFFFGDSGIIEILRSQDKIAELRSDIKELEKKKITLELEIKELKKNPLALEKTAREKLWLMKKNEKVIIVIDKKDKVRNLSELFQNKRDLFISIIADSNFLFTPSKGTYFQSVDYSEITNENDEDFAIRLTKDYSVASIPVSVFNYQKLDEKMLRFCFAKTDDTIKRGADILCSL